MSTSGTTLSDQDIVARCNSGALVLDIDRWDLNKENLASVLNRSIALHNGGRIDLLGLIDTPQFAAIGGHAFFVLQHFFCEAIPQLEAQSDHLMRAVKALVEKGGNDGAANMPNGAFRAWCAKDPARARLVVEQADNGNTLAICHLAFALEALGDVALACATVAKYSDERRRSGMTALGRIKAANEEEAGNYAESASPLYRGGLRRRNAL